MPTSVPLKCCLIRSTLRKDLNKTVEIHVKKKQVTTANLKMQARIYDKFSII